VLCELAVAESALGDPVSAEAALAEAIKASARGNDRPTELRARIELAHLHLHRGGDPDQVVSLVRKALPELESSGNDRAAGRAWRTLGYARGSLQGQCAEWLEAAERALPYVRRSGFSTSGCLSEIAAALFYGPTPVPPALARCEDILASAPDRFGAANVLVFCGGLHALTEQFDEAFEMVGTAEQIYEDLGDQYSLADSSGRIRGRIHVLTGDPQAAEEVFRKCCEIFERFQNEAALSTVGSELGQVLYSQGRHADARRWSLLSEEVAPPGDIVAQFSWRSLKGKLLAREGRLDEAEALALEAVAIAGATDALTEKGEVLLDLAEVLAAASRRADAAGRVEEALAAFDLKQNGASSRRARRRFAPAEVV
jgi:tetratricopeptide (TPR) repeat protein